MLGRRHSQWMESLLGLVAIVAVLCVHQAYLTAVHPAVPYMDTLRLLTQQEAWLTGHLSLYDIWGGTAHRGLVSNALLLANTSWFGLDALLANRMTGVVVALCASWVAFEFLRDRAADPHGAPPALVIATIALFALLLSSWAGFETLLLELGLGLWLKNLVFIAYFVALDRLLRSDAPSSVGAVALSIAGMAIVLLFAMGWAYAFVAAAWATQSLAWWGGRSLRRSPRVLLLPPVALLLAIFAYSIAGSSIAGGIGKGGVAFGARLLQPFYAIGSTWVGSEAFGHRFNVVWLLPAGLATTVVAAASLFSRWRRGIASASLVPVALLAYGGLTALSVSVARGGLGTLAVLASRYYADLVLFLVGAIWLAFEAGVRDGRKPRTVAHAYVVLSAILVIGQAWTYATEWRIAPYRARAYQAMADALLEGAGAPDDARLLQSPQPYPREAAAIMRAQRLSVFAGAGATHCNPDAVQYAGGWYPLERAGRWMQGDASLALAPCRCPAVLDLFLPKAFTPRVIDIAPVHASGPSPVHRVAMEPGSWASVPLEAGAAFHLRTSAITLPTRDLVGSGDRRPLGVLLGRLRFECAATTP